MYERLVEGCTARHHIDDPSYTPKQIFQKIVFTFNNEKIDIDLPDDAYDSDNIRLLV